MAASELASSRHSLAMERTGQWVFSQEIPTDIVIQVGKSTFPLHKFMLVAKSGYVRRKILETNQSDLTDVDLSDIPGGPEAFEKAAKFCYGINFEITIHNVVALRCAAEYLQMTDKFCEGNLAGRTEEFLRRAALNTLSSAVIVLKSCEGLLPVAEELSIVQRCVDAVTFKACSESNFPTRTPDEWWAYELAALGPSSFQKTLTAMRSRGATSKALVTAVSAYARKSLPDLLLSGGHAPPPSDPAAADARRRQQRDILEVIVSVLPADAPFHVGFLCCLLRAAIFLDAAASCRKELEKRIGPVLDDASVADLLAIALDFGGERIADLESVRRIVATFVEREGRAGGALYGGGGGEAVVCCSPGMQKVARTVDAFVGEISTDEDLSVSKFAGIAGVIPKSGRRFDDDLYRAIDIYLKSHPGLDEIEREKVCSVMDPLKLSYEARLHASQNKRLPLQIVLHALYYDQLHLRSGENPPVTPDAAKNMNRHPNNASGDASLVRENEALRSELTRMKMYVSGLQKGPPANAGPSSAAAKGPKKPTFLSSVSKKLGKLNPFRQGSKDTSSIEDGLVEVVDKPRRRRFSLS